MVSTFLFFFFVLTLAAARPSNPNLSFEQDEQKFRTDVDSRYMPNDQLLVDGQVDELDKAFFTTTKSLWPAGEVPFEIDGSFGASDTIKIFEAMDHIKEQTGGCVRFVPHTVQNDYLRIFNGSGCYSYVGRTGKGAQDLSLGVGCMNKNIIIHELGHAIGCLHEHQRPDRDEFITIHLENVKDGQAHSFDILGKDKGNYSEIYDLESIMHYYKTTFSKNGLPTMTPNDQNAFWPLLSQKPGFSVQDTLKAKRMYCQ